MANLEIFRNDPGATDVAAGTVIFGEGEPGEHAYMLIEGHIDSMTPNALLDIVGPGGIFGEMALIDHKKRSATAIAITDCLIANAPYFAVEVMKTMAERLRKMDKRLSKRC